jgi:hypothetical protein
MSFDRRILAGGPAARFFNSVASNLLDQNFLKSQIEEDVFSVKIENEKIAAIA